MVPFDDLAVDEGNVRVVREGPQLVESGCGAVAEAVPNFVFIDFARRY